MSLQSHNIRFCKYDYLMYRHILSDLIIPHLSAHPLLDYKDPNTIEIIKDFLTSLSQNLGFLMNDNFSDVLADSSYILFEILIEVLKVGDSLGMIQVINVALNCISMLAQRPYDVDPDLDVEGAYLRSFVFEYFDKLVEETKRDDLKFKDKTIHYVLLPSILSLITNCLLYFPSNYKPIFATIPYLTQICKLPQKYLNA